MNWNILHKLQLKSGSKKQRLEKITKILLENRGYKNKKEIKEFLNPDINKITPKSVGINQKELKRALSRINSAIKNKEQIAVFGDYDADGICATAILWETLNEMGADVMPYIPYRIDEGYGLSETGIKNLKLKIKNCSLIITVDNGIVANKAVDFANKKGIDVIITDHHVPSRKLPKAYSIIHTTKLCGGGVAWLLSQEILNSKFEILNKSQITNHKSQTNQHLELVVLATIADLVPLTFANRALVKCGLEELRKTKRIGLLALIQESQINKSAIDVYEVGHIIAPRLNAMGRIEYAMDSLRLLCTKDRNRAKTLAEKLASTNRRRQELTIEAFEHAKIKVKSQKSKVKSLIFIGHESYEQGVIGLVAGRLVEEFYRPSIVLSLGEKISKASARSINGFNIIEFIRGAGELLMDVGGHPMAAGFTVETSKIALLAQKFESMADKLLSDKSFQRDLRIDLEILFSDLNLNLTERLLLLSPFGVGNPKPTFLTRNLTISDMRLVGAENKHLSLKLSGDNSSFYAIGFGFGKRADEIKIGDAVDLVYTPEVDEWNGDKRIKLKVKDFKINSG